VLGLSLSKILVTILIVVAIWKALALVNRLANDRQTKVQRHSRAARSAQAKRSSTVELRPCPRCGAYIDPRHGCQCGLRRDEARRANP
jgi:hypothetical protein